MRSAVHIAGDGWINRFVVDLKCESVLNTEMHSLVHNLIDDMGDHTIRGGQFSILGSSIAVAVV